MEWKPRLDEQAKHSPAIDERLKVKTRAKIWHKASRFEMILVDWLTRAIYYSNYLVRKHCRFSKSWKENLKHLKTCNSFVSKKFTNIHEWNR